MFESQSVRTKDHWTRKVVPRVRVRNSLEFLREFVSRSEPCILIGAMEDWPAMKRWNRHYLKSKLKSTEVSVNITPNGLGDAILDGNKFVMPMQLNMKFESFVNEFEESKESRVLYLSHQNDSFRTQFKALSDDVPDTIHFATEAFGTKPDAVNLWIGDERSVTSLHKDHYENMYAVISGEKHFTLLPPSDVFGLYEREFPSYQYANVKSHEDYKIVSSDFKTSWIPVDPKKPDLEQYPLYAYTSPMECVVRSGEMLYLPAMWYHRVAQKGFTIAVNYWYDMHFGQNYVYHNFVKDLTERYLQEARRRSISSSEEGEDDSPKEKE